MPTIRERQPGVWQVRVFSGRDAHGKPTQVAVTVRGTKREAQREAARLESAPRRGAGGRTVGDVLDAWLESRMGSYAPSSLRDQTSRVHLIERDPIAKMALARVSVADVDRWLVRMRTAGVGASSRHNQLVVLRAALHQAVVWGWISNNPAAMVRTPRGKAAPREVMNPDTVAAVIAAATDIDPLAGLALRVAAVAGTRRGELAALRWDDLDGSVLTVDSSAQIVGRGAEVRVVDAPTKTAERHTVTLDDETVRLWQNMWETQFVGPYVFGDGDLPAKPDRIGWWWSRARSAAGLDRNWRLHDLRHFSATVAIGSGHDVRTVAHRLGHVDPAMTLRVYAHAVKAADEAVAVTIGNALDKARRRLL